MYQVYCDGFPLHDLRSEELVLNAPTVQLEDNNAGAFDFTISPLHPEYNNIRKMKSEIKVLHNGVEIFCGRVTEESKDFYNNKVIHCEGELNYLADSIQRPAEYHNMTVRGFLETLVNIHNAQVFESNIAITFNYSVQVNQILGIICICIMFRTTRFIKFLTKFVQIQLPERLIFCPHWIFICGGIQIQVSTTSMVLALIL